MTNHTQVLNKFKSILEEFDLKNAEHRLLVTKLFFSSSSTYIVNLIRTKIKIAHENTDEIIGYLKRM
jgi:hypothetical protein